jgi:anthranilate phosphoribosyltransferase
MSIETNGPGLDWPAVLTSLIARKDLTEATAAAAMSAIMSQEATSAQMAAFLVALRAKGETVDELAGLVDAMLSYATRIFVPGRSIDIVGTGGDRAHTVNISTMAALVIAGTGRTVVKHGNRAASSSAGSADVLEALGLPLDLPIQRVVQIASEVGITFCYANVFHTSMAHSAATRRELGIPSVFNFVGPLTNPAQPAVMALGCADLRMAPLMAGVLAKRGMSALVFRGEDGLDEIVPTAASRIWEVSGREVTEHVVDTAAELGLTPITVDQVRGADPAFNAQVVHRVLGGEQGAIREAVLVNAAAALVADGQLPGTADGSLVDRLRAGLVHAATSIDDGQAADVLARWLAAARS